MLSDTRCEAGSRGKTVIPESVSREQDTPTRGTHEGGENGADTKVARLRYQPEKAVLVSFINMKDNGQQSFLNLQGHFDKFHVITLKMPKRIPSPL